MPKLLPQQTLAPGREERETSFNLCSELLSRSTEEGAKSTIEPKLLPMVTDEVQDSANGLADAATQTSAELLQEQCWAVCRA